MSKSFEIRNPTIEKHLKKIGKIVHSVLPKNWGFTLLIFDFSNKGSMFYISDAKREDMLEAMREFIKKQGN